MSCDDPIITPGGRGGIGVIQPQSGLDFPLIDPSADIRYLLADFYLAYDDPGHYSGAALFKHPLRIKWLYGVGCETVSAPGWAPAPIHAADIIVVDADNREVFNSTQLVPEGGDPEFRRFVKRSWSADYDIYEWIGNDAVCRAVVHKTWPTAFAIAPKNWPVHLAPVDATLDERAVYKMPRRLRSLRVVSGGVQVGAKIQHRGAIFTAEHNMSIANEEPSGAPMQNTNLVFTASPGAGTGKYDDCPDATVTSRPIYRINGAAANATGDILIAASDCLFARRATTRTSATVVPDAKAITIGTNCQPCCDCSDYGAVATYMNSVAEKYAEIGRRSHQVKLLYENNIARWIEQRECRLERPLRVSLTPQNCPNMDVVVMYCNHCQPCAENIVLEANFAAYPEPETVEVVCGYTTITAPEYGDETYMLSGTFPQYFIPIPHVTQGQSAYVRFRLRFEPKTFPYSVTATLTATQNGVPLTTNCESGTAAQAVATAALNCDANGATVRSC
jgi:hypothetical protein